MGMINVSSQAGDFTNISNNFIEYYMTDANGDFVKLYLYLAMLSQAGRPITVTDIADHMSCTEKDVCRAIRYWIKVDVLSLSYSEDGEVTGITLRSLKRPDMELTSDLRLIDFGLVDTKKNPAQTAGGKKDRTTGDKNGGGKVEEALPVTEAEEAIHAPRKKQPTKEELASKLEDKELSNLISEAEAYCERELSQKELNSLIYIKDQLRFSFDLCEYLLEYCAEIKKTSFSYIEKVAKNWYEEGITNRSDAAEYSERYLTLYSKILKNMGITNRFSPAPVEKKYIDKWTGEYGFQEGFIIEACKRAITNHPNGVTFPYVNKILEDWYKSGVHSFEDISRLDEEHRVKKSAASDIGMSGGTGRNNNDKLRELEDFFLNGGSDS